MKRKQIADYRPKYPKKLLKGAILTTAAALALAGTTGCDALRTGGAPEPVPTDELVLDGEIAIDPGEDDLELLGEPAVDETGGEDDGTTGREGPALQGKIAVPEETENP
ncbi:MAG: hypothetical protein IKZ44_03270 [Clostridia bacterium]|nr:hypothetical protein [Clostridia bacterium]